MDDYFKEGLIYDMLSFFGISANTIRESTNRRFVNDSMLLTLGGVPSVTTAQMNDMKPLGKVLVGNTDDGAFYYWDGYEWKNLSSSLASNSEEIQNLLKNAVTKVDGYGLSKNDFTDQLKAMLLESFSWRHQRNKDTKISEGSKNEVTALEIRTHLDNHPKGLTDEQIALIATIKDKVNAVVGKDLISAEDLQKIIDTESSLENHIKYHPVTVIDNGATITALTPEQVALLSEITSKVSKRAGYDLVNVNTVIDLAKNMHEKNKDDGIGFGTANYVSAAEVRKFIDETNFNLFTEEDQILLQSIKDKCDKPEAGWGFSQNNFTNEEKALMVSLEAKMNEILSKPFALTDSQIAAINSISEKVTKIDGRQLTEAVFTQQEKDFLDYYIVNGFPTGEGSGSGSAPLTPEQVKLLAALSLRSDQLQAGWGLSEKNFSSTLETKLKGLTATNLTADQIAEVETIKNKVDKVDGYALSKNDFTDEYKKKVDDLKTDTHKKNQDTALGDGTDNYVTAEEIRKHLDKTGGAGVVAWAPSIEIGNGQAVLYQGFLYEAVSYVPPDFKFTTGASVDVDIVNGNLKPISTFNKFRKFATGLRVFKSEIIVGKDGKLYVVSAPENIGTTLISSDMKAEIEAGTLTLVGGGHDAGYDDSLAKETKNEVTAEEIRKHLDKDAIVAGIPDWKAGTKYMDDQPLLDPTTRIIYRVVANTTPYYITTGSTIKEDLDAGRIELISEHMMEELKAHILSVSTGGNSYVNTTTKIGIKSAPYTIKITNNINDDNKNLVQVWKVQESGTDDVVTVVKDFNNSDKDNFVGDVDAVEFDGSMYQKDKIVLVPETVTALGAGFVSEFPAIDTTLMDTIEGFKVVKG